MPGCSTPAERWWRWRRLALWQRSDRLDTFAALTAARGVPWDADAFAAFCATPLPDAAAALAAAGDAAGLALLVARHPAALGPRLLRLLAALPETLDPRTYAALLPRADGLGGAPVGLALRPARHADWCEDGARRELLAAIAVGGGDGVSGSGGAGAASSDAGGEADGNDEAGDGLTPAAAADLLHATEALERVRAADEAGGRIWPAPADAARFFARRALVVDATGGQLAHALALLDLGVQRCGADPETAVDDCDGSGVTLGGLRTLGGVLAAALRSWFPAPAATAAQGGDSSGHTDPPAAAAAAAWRVGLAEFAALPLGSQAALALRGRGAATLAADLEER